MKNKPKKLGTVIFIAVIVLVVICITNFLGIGTSYSGIRIGYSGSDSSIRQWSASYTMVNGSMKHTIHPKNAPVLYRIEVETKDGSISIEIKDSDKNLVFQEHNIQSETFEVVLTGKSVVRINADHHKGSFSIHPVK